MEARPLRDQVRARAAALGVLVEVPAPAVTEAKRRRALRGMTGIGPQLDRILEEDRGRLDPHVVGRRAER